MRKFICLVTGVFVLYAISPVYGQKVERLNFVGDPRHFDLLMQRIESMRSHREFFNLDEG